MHNNQWHMTIPALSQIWPLILKTDIHAQLQDFFWKWTDTHDEICSFASAWNCSRHVPEEFEWYHLKWYTAACPKMSVPSSGLLLASY